MLNIASVIQNRSNFGGVSPDDVVSVRTEFNAYGGRMPPGVEAYRPLAESVWQQVQKTGPVHKGTYYATPKAAGNLPGGLQRLGAVQGGHVVFGDPQGRSFRTAQGFVRPNGINNDPPVEMVGGSGLGLDDGLGLARRSPVTYGMGPARPNPPGMAIQDTIRDSVTDVLGPEYGIRITSGQENPGHRHGSNRHGTGLAADFQISDPSGRALDLTRDPGAMLDVAQAAAAKGAQGTGLGTDYMGGSHMHFDRVPPGRGQDHEWGNIGNANADLLADARKYKLMPASFYERKLPQTMAPPPSRMDVPAVPVGPVQRAPLPPPVVGAIAPGGTAASPLDPVQVGAVQRQAIPPIPGQKLAIPRGMAEAYAQMGQGLGAAGVGGLDGRLAPPMSAPPMQYAPDTTPPRVEPPGRAAAVAPRASPAVGKLDAMAAAGPENYRTMALPGGMTARTSGRYGWTEIGGPDGGSHHAGKVVAVDPQGKSYRLVTPQEATDLAGKGWKTSLTPGFKAPEAGGGLLNNLFAPKTPIGKAAGGVKSASKLGSSAKGLGGGGGFLGGLLSGLF